MLTIFYSLIYSMRMRTLGNLLLGRTLLQGPLCTVAPKRALVTEVSSRGARWAGQPARLQRSELSSGRDSGRMRGQPSRGVGLPLAVYSAQSGALDGRKGFASRRSLPAVEPSGHAQHAVDVAILANCAIFVAKGFVYMLSGSASILAEACHSVVDVLNQARMPPERAHGSMHGE